MYEIIEYSKNTAILNLDDDEVDYGIKCFRMAVLSAEEEEAVDKAIEWPLRLRPKRPFEVVQTCAGLGNAAAAVKEPHYDVR